MTRNDAPETTESATALLRVEGVNLAAFVDDTADLSTIRGGSLMLLEAIEAAIEAAQTVRGGSAPRVLSRGASAGLLEIAADNARDVAAKVRSELRRRFPGATFVVDCVVRGEGFDLENEAVLAANRWQQARSSSLAVPARVDSNAATVPCGLGGLHPAPKASPTGSSADQLAVSRIVKERREFGRQSKQNFYGRVLDQLEKRLTGSDRKRLDALRGAMGRWRFAWDFHEIASGPGELSNKLAVFYADGNLFGTIQAEYCREPEQQIAFDQLIRGQRELFLLDFLTGEVAANPSDWLGGSSASQPFVRFETLLWGGDEVMFVMPASMGLRFARHFFRSMQGLDLSRATSSKGAIPAMPAEKLSHAGALVFCQSHCPIDGVKALLSRQMASFAKEVSGRSEDSLAVLTLESFDHMPGDYRTALRRRYGQAVPVEDSLLRPRPPGQTLDKVLELVGDGIRELRGQESFARSQLRAVVQRIVGAKAKHEADAVAGIEYSPGGSIMLPHAFRNAEDPVRRLLAEKLLPCFPSPVAMWIALEELWDYAR